MSIDLFLDDGKFHPPGSYDTEKLKQVFGKKTSFVDFKSDPKNFTNQEYSPEEDFPDDDKVLSLFNKLDEIIEIVDENDFTNDVLDVVDNYVSMALEKLKQKEITESKDETLDYFKAGKLKLSDGSQVTITKAKAKVYNNILKNTKYSDKMFKTITKSSEEFTRFSQFAELNESLSSFDSLIDNKVGSWSSDETESDFKRIAGKTMRISALTGKALGLGIGTVAGVPIGATMAIRNISKAYRGDKSRRAHERMMSRNVRESHEDISERKRIILERFKSK